LLLVLIGGTIPQPLVVSAATCTTQNVLSGSNFEIDVNANLKVDGTDPCIDWLTGTSSAMRSEVFTKNYKSSGSGDDAFLARAHPRTMRTPRS
jgi:hypothetical protein